jgi:hypothetical protein
MTIKKLQATDHLADTLDQWANKYRAADDAYLSNLIHALRDRKGLHIWAELDPLDYLPHPESRVASTRTSLIRLLTVIRNVLVFSPVALTWAAIGEATTAFSVYIKENGANVVNFLDFWQNGYDTLGEKWRIGNVALLSFIIILTVIALTLYVSIAGHKAKQLRHNEEALIDADRLALAIEISTVLYDKRRITAVTMNQALAGSIARLVTATRSLEVAAKSIEKSSKKVSSAPTSYLNRFDFDSLLESPKPARGRRA